MRSLSEIYTAAWHVRARETSNSSECCEYAIRAIWAAAVDECHRKVSPLYGLGASEEWNEAITEAKLALDEVKASAKRQREAA